MVLSGVRTPVLPLAGGTPSSTSWSCASSSSRTRGRLSIITQRGHLHGWTFSLISWAFLKRETGLEPATFCQYEGHRRHRDCNMAP